MSLIVSVSGIRGTIGGQPSDNLTPNEILKFSLAYGLLLKTKNLKPTIVIGRDARISGQMVASFVIASLQSIGINVIDLGLSTTPTVEMAVINHQTDGGIIITASHNPVQWNALKLLNQLGEFISAEDGLKIVEFSKQLNIEFSTAQDLGKLNILENSMEEHVKAILNLKLIPVDLIRAKKYHIVVDCINSTGALALPILLDALSCTYELINGNPNGLFAHNPEPLEIHLQDLIKACGKNTNLGIAVDPDVDRLALVDNHGKFFGEEYSLVCVADYVLDHKLGNTVSNLSSTRALADLTNAKGAHYYACAVGEVHVVKKMKSVHAVIGGEGNGGIILPELHYGRDALVGIALILSNMATKNKSLSELKSQYPHYEMFKDKIDLNPNVDYQSLLNYLKDYYKNEILNLEDGLKIDMANGWLHLRKSNTEPIIRIYSEAQSYHTAQLLIEQIKTLVAKF
ncbi:MAG: phosphoglucosamine mutase [Saprospiraceae bacterium]